MALYRPPYGMSGLGGLGSPMDPTGMLHHRLPAYPGTKPFLSPDFFTIFSKAKQPSFGEFGCNIRTLLMIHSPKSNFRSLKTTSDRETPALTSCYCQNTWSVCH